MRNSSGFIFNPARCSVTDVVIRWQCQECLRLQSKPVRAHEPQWVPVGCAWLAQRHPTTSSSVSSALVFGPSCRGREDNPSGQTIQPNSSPWLGMCRFHHFPDEVVLGTGAFWWHHDGSGVDALIGTAEGEIHWKRLSIDHDGYTVSQPLGNRPGSPEIDWGLGLWLPMAIGLDVSIMPFAKFWV